MTAKDTVGVGLVGSQFITTIHAEALQSVPNAEVLAVMSPTGGHAQAFASRHPISYYFTELDAVVAIDGIYLGGIRAPQFSHCAFTVAAARARQQPGAVKTVCL